MAQGVERQRESGAVIGCYHHSNTKAIV